jgi:hypothetical protein
LFHSDHAIQIARSGSKLWSGMRRPREGRRPAVRTLEANLEAVQVSV